MIGVLMADRTQAVLLLLGIVVPILVIFTLAGVLLQGPDWVWRFALMMGVTLAMGVIIGFATYLAIMLVFTEVT